MSLGTYMNLQTKEKDTGEEHEGHINTKSPEPDRFNLSVINRLFLLQWNPQDELK